MSEITRYLLKEEQRKSHEYYLMMGRLHQAAKNICDKYVSPDMYERAVGEIEMAFKYDPQESRTP